MASIIQYDAGSLTPNGLPTGGPSLAVIQDCVFGGKHHGGALALGGSFWPNIYFRRLTNAGTKPTHGRPFVLWVPGYVAMPTILILISMVSRLGLRFW